MISSDKIHVLQLPRAYPYPGNSVNSIFFQEQAESIAKSDKFKVGVISVVQISFRKVKNLQWIFKNKFFVQNKNNVILYQRIIISLPFLHKFSLWIRHQLAVSLLKKYIITNGVPQLIHLQTFELGSVAIWAKQKYNIPFIVTEHMTWFMGKYPSWKLKYAENVYHNSTHRIAVSPYFAEFLSDKFKIKFHYLPNIVDTEFFKPAEKYETSKHEFIFLNVCHSVKRKNQDLLINAFYNIQKKYENIRLFIGGTGDRIPYLKKLVKELKIDGKVKFLGGLSKSEVRDYMQQSDAFILTSQHETFGVVLIEALASGIPVVSTRSGGPEIIINSDSVGELCQTELSDIIRAMEKVILSTYDKNLIRKDAIERFSAASFLNRITVIYEEVIEN